ncbi:HIT domain-containing protein [Coprothermobacter platensis]|uniref:HIT domain-containing protein n=1 Tax=Coprothermobacter platensis TaxID=108819 RepID=UPI00037F3C88|nr:HIT domain-containing protein [Coprothermobacter platensis]
MDCVFCDIINKKSPAAVEWEDDDIIVIRDAHPQAPIHLLIIPKEHFPNMDKTEPSVLMKMMDTAKQMAAKFGLTSGYRIVLNNGFDAGQTVCHVHAHLLGGRPLSWPPG